MLISASSPIVGMPQLHGVSQWVDIHQPINKVPEYQPIARRVEGIEAYQANWETLSKRLWVC